jgi:hypothetical protein
MPSMIDSLDYKGDIVEVAPIKDWRIMRITISKVDKTVPRYCKPNCDAFKRDSDGNCLLVDECKSWIFETHKVERGDTLFDVLFATSSLDPHEGFCWMVSEKYLKSLLGDKPVKKLVKQFNKFVEESEEQGFTITLDEGDENGKT